MKLTKAKLMVAMSDSIEEIRHFKVALDDELNKLKITVEEFKGKRNYINSFINNSNKELHKLEELVNNIADSLDRIKDDIDDVVCKTLIKKRILGKIKELFEEYEEDNLQ